MKNWIYTEMLFCDEENAADICEYEEMLSLVKEFIESAEDAVECKWTMEWNTKEGVCFKFAEAIIRYAKIAYDNIILGHFSAAFMVIRSMVENNVCLEILFKDEKRELWKYYIAQSVRDSLLKAKKVLSEEDEKMLHEVYVEYGICREFYEPRTKMKRGKLVEERPYIAESYGWTYMINNKFTFRGLCDLVDKRSYVDFSMMSEYSHGTSWRQKLDRNNFVEHIMNMFSGIYAVLYRMVEVYCSEYADDFFEELAEIIGNDILEKLEEF